MVDSEIKNISIAMTTYNGEKYIEKQLRSIFEQTLQPKEIIICDDCSRDQTVEIIRSIVAEYKAWDCVHLVENQQNMGYIENFRQAIRMTSGDYVFLADQDDVWYPHKLEKVLKVMEETGAEAICTGFDLIDANGSLIEDTERFKMSPFIRNAQLGLTQISFHRLAFRNYVPGCTYCCKRQVAKAFVEIESQILPHDYQIMLVGAALGRVYYLNEKLIGYRLHGNNTIGMAEKGTSAQIKLKVPRRKPKFVCFFDDMNCVLAVPYRLYYYFLYYLRIPYLTITLAEKKENFSMRRR